MTGLLARLTARGAGRDAAAGPNPLAAPVRPWFAPPEPSDTGETPGAEEVSSENRRDAAAAPDEQTPIAPGSNWIAQGSATDVSRPMPRDTLDENAQLPGADPALARRAERDWPDPFGATPPESDAQNARPRTTRERVPTPPELTVPGVEPPADVSRSDPPPSRPSYTPEALPSPPSIAETAGDTLTRVAPSIAETAGDALTRVAPPVDTQVALPHDTAAITISPGEDAPNSDANRSDGPPPDFLQLPEPDAPRLSIGRVDVVFEAPQPAPTPARRSEPERTKGFERYGRARLGLRR